MTLAFDRSQRTKDQDGRLHVAWTPISKAMVCPYWGREIPDFEALGLEPDRVYHLWRHPEELAKAAGTFNNIQLMSEHIAVSADSPNEKQVAGSTGTDCEFRPPYLGNSMVIWRAEDIAAIESNARRQLSAGYYYRADMTPGEYEGLRYDGIMRDIRGNHVALVEAGRAGPDVLVTDTRETTMPAVPLSSRKALLASGAIRSLLRPNLMPGTTLALDGALGGVNRLNWKTEKPKVLAAVVEYIGPKLAKDAKIDQIKADLQLALDRMDDEDDGEAEDDMIQSEDEDLTEAEKEAKAKAEQAAKDKKARDAKRAKDKAAKDTKAAKDAEEDDDDKDDDDDKAKDTVMDQKAMDAAIESAETRIVKRMNDAIEAREIVRPLVGQVALALDSAEAIFKFALDAHKVPTKDVHPSAFKAMVGMIPKPGQQRQMATDAAPSAALQTRFPQVARFGQ